jgi:predicted dinucleotide-binding enzyme
MPAMRTYRCYLLDEQLHIASARVVVCSDDEAAKLRAREILAGQPGFRGVELWEMDRRVEIDASSDDAQAPLDTAP